MSDHAFLQALAACEVEPRRAHGRADLAAWAATDPDLHFRWRLVELRRSIEDDTDGNSRELYGALLEEYRAQPERLAALRLVGEVLRTKEASGELPRTLLRRTPR